MDRPSTPSEMGRKGGLARAKALTKKERIEIARKAGSAPKKARSAAKRRKTVKNFNQQRKENSE